MLVGGLKRLTPLYGAHLLLFFIAAFFVRIAAVYFARVDYVDFLQVKHLFADPRHYIPAALTLSYSPKYLDILPLYLILLGVAPRSSMPSNAIHGGHSSCRDWSMR